MKNFKGKSYIIHRALNKKIEKLLIFLNKKRFHEEAQILKPIIEVLIRLQIWKVYDRMVHIQMMSNILSSIGTQSFYNETWFYNETKPPGITNWADHSEYYDFLYDEKERLEKIINHPDYEEEKIKINSGDWVTIDLDYAKQHGRSSLNGEYKILRATVFAMKLYTDGNSILEWAYIA